MTIANLIPRSPVVCGALGRYDPRLVQAIAGRLEPSPKVVHRDRTSILMLDREPLRWRSGLARGLAWSEGTKSAEAVRSWEDAATEWNACGLAISPRRRLVHSSVAGVAPIYHVDFGGATYFATRIDPLVTALPMRFEIDWDAWASILCLTHPVGDRTPFAEVRRLPPYATLERRGARGRATRHRWPWAEIEPDLDVERGAPLLLERLREVVAGLPEGPLTALLSGGWDSRVVACLFAEARPDGVRALTLTRPGGQGVEAEIATAVARELGLPHELVVPPRDRYWERWQLQAAGRDYQCAPPLFVSPLQGRLRMELGVVGDGLGADTLWQRGGTFIDREMLSPDGSRATAMALWRIMRRMGSGGALRRLYSRDLIAGMDAASRRAFLRATRPVRGHPAEALLSLYLTRTVRAITALPQSVLGAHCAIVTPLVDHRAASACLRITPTAKFGSRLHPAILDALSRPAARVPSTNNPTPELKAERHRARRLALHGGSAPEAILQYARTLADGPLAPHFAPDLRAAVVSRDLEDVFRNPRSDRAVLAAVSFHLWHERYRDLLRPVDAGELMRA